jgi:TorA maturation chaperone TorD
MADSDDLDLARAQEYALLSTLLAQPPGAGLLGKLAVLSGDGTRLGSAHIKLAEAAAQTDPHHVEREYFEMFIGLGRGELLPYASYYLTGFLNERPLARLRDDLNRLQIERAAGQSEPEDHIAILCEIMAGIACRRFDMPDKEEQAFFARHIAPWAARFFADLESARDAVFYRSVGTLGRTFIEIEMQAFALQS